MCFFSVINFTGSRFVLVFIYDTSKDMQLARDNTYLKFFFLILFVFLMLWFKKVNCIKSKSNPYDLKFLLVVRIGKNNIDMKSKPTLTIFKIVEQSIELQIYNKLIRTIILKIIYKLLIKYQPKPFKPVTQPKMWSTPPTRLLYILLLLSNNL